jgi:hypothetical protein
LEDGENVWPIPPAAHEEIRMNEVSPEGEIGERDELSKRKRIGELGFN